MANDVIFTRDRGKLYSGSNGEVDLGCSTPSPALLLSTKTFTDKWWTSLGGKRLWTTLWEQSRDDVKQAARDDVDSILGDATMGKMEIIRRLAESTKLCALMDAMRSAESGRWVAVDTPLAEALAVRKHNTPQTPCHEVVVSSLDHEIKSITGYPASKCLCYARAGGVGYHRVAVGGVCLKVTGTVGDVLQPVVPGKLVIYQADWMTPWTAILCLIGAVNTLLMAAFLAATPWNPGLTTQTPAFWFLLVNVVTEVVAIGMGWSLRHRWQMGWRKYLVRSDPFHALLTADRADSVKVEWILGFEAVGGVASVFGIAFTAGVPLEVLSSVVVPVFTAFLASYFSESKSLRTPLIVCAMTFYLLEFVYEIVVLVRLDDSILGWVVILSCIAESVSLVWILTTVLYALHFLSTSKNEKHGLFIDRAPDRIRDGTLAVLRLPDLPTCGLMGTSALGSAVLGRGCFVEDGSSAIKPGTPSYECCQPEAMPQPAGWLSLKSCGEPSTAVMNEATFSGNHEWLGDIIVACGLAIPVLGY